MIRTPVRVLIADLQRLFARSLAILLNGEGKFQAIDEDVSSGLETLKAVAGVASPCDLVILDYWIRGMTGPATTRALLRFSEPPKVVLMGSFHTPSEVNEAFAAGASAFVSKTVGFPTLLEVLEGVAAGRSGLYAPDAGRPIQEIEVPAGAPDEVVERLATLTLREIEVLSLLSFAPVEKVAKILAISLGTLRNHIYNILRKTDARSQIEAIDIARRQGLIDG